MKTCGAFRCVEPFVFCLCIFLFREAQCITIHRASQRSKNCCKFAINPIIWRKHNNFSLSRWLMHNYIKFKHFHRPNEGQLFSEPISDDNVKIAHTRQLEFTHNKHDIPRSARLLWGQNRELRKNRQTAKRFAFDRTRTWNFKSLHERHETFWNSCWTWDHHTWSKIQKTSHKAKICHVHRGINAIPLLLIAHNFKNI